MAFTPVMEAEPKQARPEAGHSPGVAGSATRTTRHLLVVDDEQPVRSVVRMMGEHLGYVVSEAVNGAEALNQLQKNPGGIKVVLTDVNMPVMDGLALVRAIKKMPVAPAVGVMSGRFDPVMRATLQAEGITVLMGKPFSTDELGLTLGQIQAATR